MAAVTGGDVTITGVEPNDLRATLLAFSRLGVRVEIDGTRRARAARPGADDRRRRARSDPKIDDGPWPAFPADLTSIAVAVATQARGTVLIFEKMFENRLVFTDKLVNDGRAHRPLRPAPVRHQRSRAAVRRARRVADIRAGMALLIVAGLAAAGTSVIGNVGQIDRGYERIDERLRALGARIERVAG